MSRFSEIDALTAFLQSQTEITAIFPEDKIKRYVALPQGQQVSRSDKFIAIAPQGGEAEITFDIVEQCGLNTSTAIFAVDILLVNSTLADLQRASLLVLQKVGTFRSLLPSAPPRITQGRYGETEGSNAMLTISLTYRISLTT